jgi:hypothetical protein
MTPKTRRTDTVLAEQEPGTIRKKGTAQTNDDEDRSERRRGVGEGVRQQVPTNDVNIACITTACPTGNCAQPIMTAGTTIPAGADEEKESEGESEPEDHHMG